MCPLCARRRRGFDTCGRRNSMTHLGWLPLGRHYRDLAGIVTSFLRALVTALNALHHSEQAGPVPEIDPVGADTAREVAAAAHVDDAAAAIPKHVRPCSWCCCQPAAAMPACHQQTAAVRCPAPEEQSSADTRRSNRQPSASRSARRYP